MNKILSFFNSRLTCGGGAKCLTNQGNKQFREEELLLISDVKSNFNSQINLRDNLIFWDGELSKSSFRIQTQNILPYEGSEGDLVAFSLNMGGVI